MKNNTNANASILLCVFPSGKISITGKIYSEIEGGICGLLRIFFDKLKFEIQVKAT